MTDPNDPLSGNARPSGEPPADRLVPVDRHHLKASIAIALTSGSREEKNHAAEAAAMLVAGRIVEMFERGAYVVMRPEKPWGRGTPAGPPQRPAE